jgi:hypothetical protein
MASTFRKEVNASICTGIHDRMSAVERAGLRLLEERDADGTTQYNRLKKSARSPTWSHFKRLTTHLDWVDALGDSRVLAERVNAGQAAMVGLCYRLADGQAQMVAARGLDITATAAS